MASQARGSYFIFELWSLLMKVTDPADPTEHELMLKEAKMQWLDIPEDIEDAKNEQEKALVKFKKFLVNPWAYYIFCWIMFFAKVQFNKMMWEDPSLLNDEELK